MESQKGDISPEQQVLSFIFSSRKEGGIWESGMKDWWSANLTEMYDLLPENLQNTDIDKVVELMRNKLSR